jgi:hypothetical protein
VAAANDALDAKAADLLALQRASSEATLRLQREQADLQAALDDARRADEAARRRILGLEERLAASQQRQAEVEANAAELERSLGEQLRAALAQAERYQALAVSEQQKREEATRVMAEMREQMAAAAHANREALDAAEAQAADARHLAELYEGQVAELTAQLRALQTSGGGAAPAAPGTPSASQPPPSRPTGGGGAEPRGAAAAAELLAACLEGRSHADVVAAYADVVHAYRMERLRAAELEANLDRLCVAANRKANDIGRQRKEYEGARAAHVALQAVHAEAMARAAQQGARLAELERDLTAERRTVAGLRQGLADKERQLGVFVAEVERLNGRPLPESTPASFAGATANDSLDAAGIIDARLVTFASLGQLVEKNSQLLAVARSLADDLDAARSGVEARVAEIRSTEAAETERRISELTAMCTALAAEAQACKRAADEALRDRQAGGAGGSGGAGGPGPEAAELEAARKRIGELETTVSHLRTDGAETAALLKQQLEAARSDAASARADAASARAQQQVLSNASRALQQQAADAQARGERLATQLGDQRGLVERLEGQLEEVRRAGGAVWAVLVYVARVFAGRYVSGRAEKP